MSASIVYTFVCDACQKRAEVPGPRGEPPDGWFVISRRMILSYTLLGRELVDTTQHACGSVCAGAVLRALAMQIDPVVPYKPE